MTDAISDDEDFEELYRAWEPTLYAVAMADDRYFALLKASFRVSPTYAVAAAPIL